MTNRTRVALIFGGRSSEHGISCLTAASVLDAIDRSQFDVVAIGITTDGRWRLVPLEEVAGRAKPVPAELVACGEIGLGGEFTLHLGWLALPVIVTYPATWLPSTGYAMRTS